MTWKEVRGKEPKRVLTCRICEGAHEAYLWEWEDESLACPTCGCMTHGETEV